MIVIIEGNDCSGKSMISKMLKEVFDKNVYFQKHVYLEETFKHVFNFKHEPEKWEYFITGFNAQTLNLFANFDDFIKDRFHFSEYVYSKYTNRKSYLDFEIIEDFLTGLEKKIIVVYLECSYETYLKRMKPEEEAYVYSKNHYETLNNEFSIAYEKSKLPKIKINTDEISPETLKNQLSIKLQDFWIS